MSIEARVHAPTASFAERIGVYGLAGAVFGLGLVAANTFPFADKLLIAGLWIWLVSPLLLRRPRGTLAHIECGGGEIYIRPDRMPPRTVKTGKLAGASVVRNGDGAVVTLSERGSRSPIAIEVKSADAANELRSALGIPHGGFGEILWCLEPHGGDLPLAFTRAVAALLFLLAFAMSALSGTVSSELMTLGFAMAFIAAVIAVARFLTDDRTLRMHAGGMLISTDTAERMSFADIEEITDDGKAIVIREKASRGRLIVRCAPTRLSSGMSAEERAFMIAQLQGALVVSNGGAAPFVDPTSHLDALKRNDASPADWLARLDALASLQTSAAYRTTTIAKDDLWRALESHDASAEVRAGAARVLLRISPEKEQDRIARAIDSIHDDGERAHIRAALRDDLEEAAAALEATERRLDPSRR